MRTNKATHLWISCALVCLWGCGQEGINSPIPDFKVPDNIDPISRNVIAEKYDALQQDSHSEDAWKMFAGACLANEIFSEAVAAYEVILAHDPQDAESTWRCAVAYAELGDLEQAINLSTQNIELFRCIPECSRRIAKWRFTNGEIEQAKDRLADRSECGFEDFWMDLLDAEICINEGKFGRAKGIIQKHKLPLENSLFRLAELTARRLNDNAWMTELNQSDILDDRIPPDPWIDSLAPMNRTVLADRRRAESLIGRKPTVQSSQQLKYLHDARAGDPWFTATYAMSLLQMGQIDEAALVVTGLKLERSQWNAEYWMVTALVRMKQYEKKPSKSAAQSILQACTNVLEVDPEHLTATKTSAKAYRFLGNFNAEAKAWLQASVVATSEQDRIICLGSSYQAVGRQGDWTRASSSFDLLIGELSKDDAKSLWAAAGDAAIKAGRNEKANQYIALLRASGSQDAAEQLERMRKP